MLNSWSPACWITNVLIFWLHLLGTYQSHQVKEAIILLWPPKLLKWSHLQFLHSLTAHRGLLKYDYSVEDVSGGSSRCVAGGGTGWVPGVPTLDNGKQASPKRLCRSAWGNCCLRVVYKRKMSSVDSRLSLLTCCWSIRVTMAPNGHKWVCKAAVSVFLMEFKKSPKKYGGEKVKHQWSQNLRKCVCSTERKSLSYTVREVPAWKLWNV